MKLYLLMFVSLLFLGCECESGEEKCAGEFYHMKCVDQNWELVENCLEI